MKTLNIKIYGLTQLLVTCYVLFIIVAPVEALSATIKSVGNNGLVGYWTFDEGAGSKVNDMSGNKNVGTLIHSPTWEAGKSGRALLLNNSNSYVSVTSNSSLKYVGGNMSLEAWIYPNIGETSAVFISKPWNGNGDYNYRLSYGPVIGFYLVGNGSCTVTSGANTAPQGSWHHIVATVSSLGAMNLYIDGMLVGSGSCGIVDWTPTYGDANLPLSIGTLYPYGAGAWDQPTHAFGGKMDSVRLYNRVLSATEVKSSYRFGTAQTKSVQKSGLVGYWPMNEGVGSKVNDMSGGKNTGTLAGTTLPSWVSGRFGKALFFDGATSKVSLGSLNISTDVTISAWVNTATAGQRPVLSNRSGGSGKVYLGVTGGKFFVYDNGATPPAMTSNASINTSTWKHVVWTSDGATSNMYINGVFDKTQAHTRTGGIANGNIGWDLANNVEYFPGYIDDVRVYNRALSATEVQLLYGQNATQVNASTNNFLNNGLIYVFSLNGGDISWGSNTAYDRSGQGNNATLISFSTTSSPATGKLGQGLKFNGVSTYLNTPAMAFLGQASATFSVSVWVKPRVVGGTIIHNMNESVGWSTGLIGFRGGKLSYNIYANGFADSPNTAVAGRWLLVSFTRDGVTGVNKLYENGVLVKTTTTGYSPSGGSHKFTLGRFVADCCQMDSPGWFDGVMDDYRLYNRVLSESEIKQLYNMAR